MNKLITLALRLGNTLSLLIETCISLIRVVVFTRKPSSLPVRQQVACAILGNGPSLRETLQDDIAFLKTTELICVNNFVASDYYEVLKPTNYILFDAVFFELDSLQAHREDVKAMVQGIRNRTTWPMNLYVTQKAKKSPYFQEILQHNPNLKAVYCNYTIFTGFETIKYWFFKKGLGMPQIQNVMVAALFLMIGRRFEKIYLFGADHSWHENIRVGDDGGLEAKDVHFYDKAEKQFVKFNEIKHFHVPTMSQQFVSLSKAFYGYEVLAKYAKKNHVLVLNASKKSYVDAFPKIKL